MTDVQTGVLEPQRGARPVFDPFVRFDTGRRPRLGLAIAAAFVEAHGQHIGDEEAPGGGAMFVVTLALAATNGSNH